MTGTPGAMPNSTRRSGVADMEKHHRELADFLLVHINRLTFLNTNSLNAEISRRTASECADYIFRKMERALSFDEPLQLLSYAMGKVALDGLVLEFGVYSGETVNHIAAFFKDKRVFGFDSFEGLKEDWHGHHNSVAGTFNRGGNPPPVRANVQLVKGWFDKTVPDFAARTENAKIAFLHVDSDTYESAKTILDSLGRRLAKGSVVVFDEYLNYRGWKIGEFKAWQEFCAEHRVAYDYLGFCIHGEQVALQVTDILP